jgi:hypothetical protein
MILERESVKRPRARRSLACRAITIWVPEVKTDIEILGHGRFLVQNIPMSGFDWSQLSQKSAILKGCLFLYHTN